MKRVFAVEVAEKLRPTYLLLGELLVALAAELDLRHDRSPSLVNNLNGVSAPNDSDKPVPSST